MIRFSFVIPFLLTLALCRGQDIPAEEQSSAGYKPNYAKTDRHVTQNGSGPDSVGGAGVDPTENVKALSEALSRRQDDLRDLNNRYLDARINAIKEVVALRAEHSKEVRILEADRLRAIREVDVSNTAITAAQQLAAVQTLAATATSTADTARANLATTATAIQNQTDRIVTAINERIALLEKTSNIVAGRAGIADPATEKLAALVEKLAAAQSQGTGKSEGMSASVAAVLAGLTVVSLLIAIVTSVSSRRKQQG